jgi:hypothetical protein
MTRYRPTANDLIPTDEELAAARTASSAPQTGTAWGGGLGTVLGGAAGLGASALLGLGTGGVGLALAPELIGGGAAAGGALGSAIGGSIGNKMGQDAGDQLTAAQAKRQKLLDEDQRREEALAKLMATR